MRLSRSRVGRGRTRAAGDGVIASRATLLTIGVGGPDYDLTKLRAWLNWRAAQG
jgi:hypothetical protein